jgi:hypothetical protein
MGQSKLSFWTAQAQNNEDTVKKDLRHNTTPTKLVIIHFQSVYLQLSVHGSDTASLPVP